MPAPPALSPPASPVAMPPPVTRPLARTPSMDSAVSSLSSTASQPRLPSAPASRPATDPVAAAPPDMARLVAQAGSAEAALLALWKEKQSTANHNAQLWRLVEKQRVMVIGLQKDLERALKDKDRYRRTLKRYADHTVTPATRDRADTLASTTDRDISQSPSPSPAFSERPDTTEYKMSPLTQQHRAPSPSPSPPTAAPSPTIPASPSAPASPVAIAADPHLQAPKLSLTQATPVVDGHGFDTPLRKPAPPLRKPPPAPLDLSKPITTSAHLHQAVHGNDDGVDSDYDDSLQAAEIPIMEQRGRRKTREEDDRIREALCANENEASSKATPHTTDDNSRQTLSTSDQHAPTAPVVPLSPRQYAGLPLSPRHPPPATSLNALLSPATSDPSITATKRSVTSLALPLLSPGLPSSPRPTDRPLGSPLPRHPKSALASPPMSPSAMSHAVTLKLPPQGSPAPYTPQSFQSPSGDHVHTAASLSNNSLSGRSRAPGAQPSPGAGQNSPAFDQVPDAEHVYRGLVSDQYPGLLLPPNALPSIQVRVFSSRLRPSRLSMLAPNSREDADPVFILAIYARSDGKQLWRVEKTIATLPVLDTHLKTLCDFQGRIPERALFGGHAPARIDARRIALNQYFDAVLETPMNEQAARIVCEYFSTDVIGAQFGDRLAPEPVTGSMVAVPKTRQRKEGYLTKRGKNFGGWKARFFVLDGPDFRYFEGVGGAHLGTIKLHNAQIGKQSQQQSGQSPQRRDDSEENQYRHAFLILEPKRKDSTSLVRHVLCAENDEERDAWVDALLQHVDFPDDPSSPVEMQIPAVARLQKQQPSQDSFRSQPRESPDLEKSARLQGFSYEDTVAAEAPVRGRNHRDVMGGKPSKGSPKNGSFSQDSLGHYPSISAPSNGTPIRDGETWGNKPTVNSGPALTKDRKRSIFGFRGRGGSSELMQIPSNNQLQPLVEQRAQLGNRSIFGIPLQEAVDLTQPVGVAVLLPAVVYRCLEYLKAKQAINEEGIFRLSGSNIVIKSLRERFNVEGDIKLLDGQYYDVHAIASLLKLYLRELPSSILTRELHLDFLKVLDMDERSKKIQTFNVLVHKLPGANFELLQQLSSFLIEIVNNAAINKMTVRNVGIVFAPTLNIPAPLIAFFLTDFPDIFGTAIDEANSPIHELRNGTSFLADEAIRSPRRQMFSDLPTPAYHETTFQQRLDRPPHQANSALPPVYPPPQPPQLPQHPREPSEPQSQQEHQQTSSDSGGFISMRPSYDSPVYEQPYSAKGDGYSSLNGAVQGGTAREQKQRRRESGMMFVNMGLGMGQRQGSNSSGQQQRIDHRGVNPLTVKEETTTD